MSVRADVWVGICPTDERCKRLTTVPVVGQVIATALVAAVVRQYATGGKPRLGRIGNMANHYLRRQLAHGAGFVLLRIARCDDRHQKWTQALQPRAGHNTTFLGMANKTARMAWLM